MSTFIDPWLRRFDDDVSSTQRHLLLVIASYIGQGEWCWPTQGTLASELGCTITTVNRSVRTLAKLGYIDTSYTTVHGRTVLRMRFNKVWLRKVRSKYTQAPVQEPLDPQPADDELDTQDGEV